MKNITKLLSMLLLPLALTGCFSVEMQETIDYKGNVTVNGTVDLTEFIKLQQTLEDLKDPVDRVQTGLTQEFVEGFCEGVNEQAQLENDGKIDMNGDVSCFKKGNNQIGIHFSGKALAPYFEVKDGQFILTESFVDSEEIEALKSANLSEAELADFFEKTEELQPKLVKNITLPKPILSTNAGKIKGNSIEFTSADQLEILQKVLSGEMTEFKVVSGDLPEPKYVAPKKVKVIQTNTNKNRRTTLRYSNQQARPVYLPARRSFTPVRIEKKEIPMIELVPAAKAAKVEVEEVEQVEILLPTEIELIEEIVEEISPVETITESPVNTGFAISELQVVSNKKRGE